MDRSWHGKYVAVLLQGARGGQQGPTPFIGFHDQHSPRQATDESIATWEVPRQWRCADGKLGDDAALLDDARGEFPIAPWIVEVRPGTGHCDTRSLAFEATHV